MSFNVRLFGYSGIVQVGQSHAQQYSGDAVFLNEEPCLWSQILVCDGSTVATSARIATVPDGTQMVCVEVPDNHEIRYEVVQPGAAARTVSDSSRRGSGFFNLAWSAGYTLSIIDAVPVVSVLPPSALTGLLGWWDASVHASLGLSGSNISSIADQSGFGNTMFSVGGIADPTYSATGFNGKPGISTNIASPSSFETSSPFAMGTGNTLTAWWVGTNAGASSLSGARYLSYGDVSIQDNDNVGYWCINQKGSNRNLIDVSRRVSVVTPVDVAISTGNHIVIVTIDSSGIITMYLDGVAHTLQTEPGNWISAGQVAIGRKAETNSTYIQATFGECGIASGFTDPTNVAGLNLYLKNKWGL